MRLNDSPTHIYIIANQDGAHKIGISADPRKRMMALQTERKEKLRIVATYQSPSGRTALLERRVHGLLNDKRIGQEWFAVTAGQAVEVVEQALLDLEAEPIATHRSWTIPAVKTSLSRRIIIAARREGITVGQLVERVWDEWQRQGRQTR